MKVLAFAASNSRSSINKRLVTHAAEVFAQEIDTTAETEVIDLNDYELPIYSEDREADGGVPELAKALYAKLGEADAILISYAEHNGNYSAVWKNTFDWMSRIDQKVFQDKPMVIMATSPGQGGGGRVLKIAEDSIGVFGANVKGSVSVATFGDNFDRERGRLTHGESSAALKAALTDLHAAL